MRQPHPNHLDVGQLSLRTLFGSITLVAILTAVGSGAFGGQLQQLAGVFLIVLAYGLSALAPIFATVVLFLLVSRLVVSREPVAETVIVSRPRMER